jgi:hypothetical protein
MTSQRCRDDASDAWEAVIVRSDLYSVNISGREKKSSGKPDDWPDSSGYLLVGRKANCAIAPGAAKQFVAPVASHSSMYIKFAGAFMDHHQDRLPLVAWRRVEGVRK